MRERKSELGLLWRKRGLNARRVSEERVDGIDWNRADGACKRVGGFSSRLERVEGRTENMAAEEFIPSRRVPVDWPSARASGWTNSPSEPRQVIGLRMSAF